jgi:hypothetical protein
MVIRAGIFGIVAQLGERCIRIAEVEGSNPFGSIMSIMKEPLLSERAEEVFCGIPVKYIFK